MICILLLSGVSLAWAVSAQAQETAAYAYDVHGRLVAVERSGGVNDGVDTAYAYDDADNRTGKTTTGALLLRSAEGEPEAADDDDDGDVSDGLDREPDDGTEDAPQT